MTRSRPFWRLLLGNLLVLSAVAAGIVVWGYRRLDRDYQAETRRKQEQLALLLAGRLEDQWPLPAERVDSLCRALPRDPDDRVTVIATDGNVLGDSSAVASSMANHRTADRPEVLAALDGQTGVDERSSATTSVRYRYVAVPVRKGGTVVAAVRLAVPIQAIAKERAVFRDVLLISVVGVAAMAAALGLLVARTWRSILRDFGRTAKRIASGDHQAPARPGGPGDWAGLARTLQGIREGHLAQVRQIRSREQDLQTVLAGLREGIVASDAGGSAVLINRAAADLLGVKMEEACGRKLEALVPSLEILNLYRDAIAGGRAAAGQVELDRPGGRRILDVEAAPTTGEAGGIRGILVLRDVTELANAAAMKSQFVANASHELRTPLATIRAAVDSLADLDPAEKDDFRRCLEILSQHVSRLEALARDMLDLHLVESGKVPLRVEDVPLADLAEGMRGEFEARARDKGLQWELHVQPAGAVLRSDRALVELILRNLLDNAIKYTPAGGTVEFSLDGADPEGGAGGAVLRVRDTGVGISPQDQGRVFERFFQSDAARSGDARRRGTGLGLAIVKHAAERLGAKVDLQSELGKGTTITVTVPSAGGAVPHGGVNGEAAAAPAPGAVPAPSE